MRPRVRPTGTALVETAATAFLAALLLSGALFLGRLALGAHRAHALARFAASLSAAGVPAPTMQVELNDYAARLGGPSDFSWTIGRYTGSASARFYRMVEAAVRSEVVLPPALGGGRRDLLGRAVIEEESV